MFKINKKNLKHIPKYLKTWLFGGKWKYGRQPSLRGRISKYYFENWNKAGYTLWGFIKPEIKNWINIV